MVVVEGLGSECDREALKEIAGDCYATYQRGEPKAFLKFKEVEGATTGLEALKKCEDIKGAKPTRVEIIEGDEEVQFYANDRANFRKKRRH